MSCYAGYWCLSSWPNRFTNSVQMLMMMVDPNDTFTAIPRVILQPHSWFSISSGKITAAGTKMHSN